MFQNISNHQVSQPKAQPSVSIKQFTHENVNEAFGLSQELWYDIKLY